MAKTTTMAEEQQNEGLERIKSTPAKLTRFLSDVRGELSRVSTPSREEVRSTTTVVILTIFVFAFFFWAVDYAINHTLNAFITHLTQR